MGEAKKKAKTKTKRKSKGLSPSREQERSSSSDGNAKQQDFSEVVTTSREIVMQTQSDSENGQESMERCSNYRSSNVSPSRLPETTVMQSPLEASKKLMSSQNDMESLTRIPSITDGVSIYQNSVLFDDFSVQPFDHDELKRASNRYGTSVPSRAQRKPVPFQYPKQGVETTQVLEVSDEEENNEVEHTLRCWQILGKCDPVHSQGSSPS